MGPAAGKAECSTEMFHGEPKLRNRCIGCQQSAPPWRFTPRHRVVKRGAVRLQILVICGACGRTWWTVQRGIVSRWFVHFEMRPPKAMGRLYAA